MTWILALLTLVVHGGSTEMMTLNGQGPRNQLLLHNHTKVPLRFSCDNVSRICTGDFTECRKNVCNCLEGYAPRADNPDHCGERMLYTVDLRTDPTMIGVVIGLVLMSVTLCIVMRLFAKARFRENRTIFNTPNPRLMNVSLVKGSKHFFRGHSAIAASGRRGSSVSDNSEADTPPPQSTAPQEMSRGRGKVLRQQSTDTTVDTPTPSTSGGAPRLPKTYKYRQDSVASNSHL